MHTLDSFCAMLFRDIAEEHSKLTRTLLTHGKQTLADVEFARGHLRGIAEAENIVRKARQKFATEDGGDF